MLAKLMRLVGEGGALINPLPPEIIGFIHDIMNEADSNLNYINFLFQVNQYSMSFDILKTHRSTFDYFLLIANLEECNPFLEKNGLITRFDTLSRKFNHTFMRLYLALTYESLDDYGKALANNDFKQADIFHYNVQILLNLLVKFYEDAQNKGLQQTEAFIDFPKDYKKLRERFENLKERHKISAMLNDTFNFSRTLIKFGKASSLFFKPEEETSSSKSYFSSHPQ